MVITAVSKTAFLSSNLSNPAKAKFARNFWDKTLIGGSIPSTPAREKLWLRV